jgi:hypothetical protein
MNLSTALGAMVGVGAGARISLRLGEGIDTDTHIQSLVLEKRSNRIRIGTYRTQKIASDGSKLIDDDSFMGMEIIPDDGVIEIKGYTPTATAVFG